MPNVKIKVLVKEDVKIRTEFTGWKRIFEPYKNLSLTILTLIASVSLLTFLIYFGVVGSSFKMTGWNKEFNTKGEALAYVNTDSNYDTIVVQEKKYEFIDASGQNYYGLADEKFDSYEDMSTKLREKMISYNSWKEVFISDSSLQNGQYNRANTYATNVGLAYLGHNGIAYRTIKEAISSFTTITGKYTYNTRIFNTMEDAIDNYKISNQIVVEQQDFYRIDSYVTSRNRATGIGTDAEWVPRKENTISDFKRQVIEEELWEYKNYKPSDYTVNDWKTDIYNDGDYYNSQIEWLLLNPFIKQGPFYANSKYPTPADYDTTILANIAAIRCEDNSATNFAEYFVNSSEMIEAIPNLTPPLIDCANVADGNPPINSAALRTFWQTIGTNNGDLWNAQRPSVPADFDNSDESQIAYAMWSTNPVQLSRGNWNGNIYESTHDAISDIDTYVQAQLDANAQQQSKWTYKVGGIETNLVFDHEYQAENYIYDLAVQFISDTSTYSSKTGVDVHNWNNSGLYTEALAFYSSRINSKVVNLDLVESGVTSYTPLEVYTTPAFIARNFNNQGTDFFFNGQDSLMTMLIEHDLGLFKVDQISVNKTKYLLNIDDSTQKILGDSINDVKNLWVEMINKKR